MKSLNDFQIASEDLIYFQITSDKNVQIAMILSKNVAIDLEFMSLI